MNIPKISIETARSIAVAAQKLDGQNPTPDLTKVFDQLGYVQIDTISVVNRAHLHTLWTRNHNFAEEDLYKLQEERKIYEYWGHAMSYLRMEDFRYSLPRMQRFKDPNSGWFKSRYSQTQEIIPEILKRIRNEGPLGSAHFERTDGQKGGVWWDWKPAKIALEVLYWQGELMISGRKKFQKIYDLTERVLPEWIDKSFPTQDEVSKFVVMGALKSFGVATEKEIGMFMQPGSSRESEMKLASKKEIKATLQHLTEEGEIMSVNVEGLEQQYFSLTETIKHLSGENQAPVVRFLSPFDNLIIQRERVRQLFGFDYTIECYAPEPKRKYGYYVFPVLLGNNLVARFDPKADRKNQTLILKNLWFEENFKNPAGFLPLFVNELREFASFNQCFKIIVESCSDQKFHREIIRKLSQSVV
jgi:uncharacterized protein YcaQ